MEKKNLPDFYGVLEVQHYIKGRLRLKINVLAGNYDACKELESRMISLRGIYSIKSNPMLGTLLIEFDENEVSSVILMGAILNLLGLEDEAFSRKSGFISSIFSESVSALDSVIYNKTKGILDIKSTLGMFLLYYGVKKIRQNPVLPNGVNLLWWAYSLISKDGK